MYIPTITSGDVVEDFLFFGKKGDDKLSQWSSLIGIVTAIVGNILISFALNIQRYAHIRIDEDLNRRRQDRKAQKKLPKAIRNYGAAVQQAQVAEERSRLNASAPGPVMEAYDEELSSDDSESTPLNGSANPRKNSQDGNEHNEKDDGRQSYLSSPYWWVGISLMAVGEAGNFLAYGFAPASIVSPLGVVALISNCLIAPMLLKEHFRKRDFWGVLVAIGGAVTIVFSARTSEAKMGPDKLWSAIRRWEFLAYVLITMVFIVILMFASPRYGRRTILIDLGLVGLFGGYTALSTKGVAAMLSGALFRAFTFPITYVLIIVLIGSAIMQIRYINRALSNFDSTQVIPTQFVLFTLSVIIGSAVLYRDFEKTDLEHVAKFVAGCLLTFSGVWLITSGRKNGDDDDEDDDYAEDETIQLIDEERVSERGPSTGKQSDAIDAPKATKPTRPSVNTETSEMARSMQSLATTPAASNISLEDHSVSSSLHPLHPHHGPVRPITPRQDTKMTTNSDGTPFFTPSSVPVAATRPLGLQANHSDSALLTPVTPTRPPRNSPSRPTLVLPNGEVYETPPSGLLRSARGSIHRFIPAPLIPPLPGALNTMVAEHLLRGEGSPRFLRDAVRRRKSARSRTQPASQSAVPQSAIESPPLSRWTTTDGDVPETPRTAISDYIPSEDASGRKRGRLGSFGDTLTDFFKKNKKPNRQSERDSYPSIDAED